MQKKLLSGLFWVLLLNLIVKPFWILGIEVGVQNAVGAEDYGFYFAIFNLAYIFNILLDVGITNFNTRNIAQHPQLIDKHLSGLLSVKLLLLALYAVVTFTVGLLLGYDSRQFWLLALLSINQFLNSLILYLRSNFEGLLLFKCDSVISVMDRVVMIVICGALLWWPGCNDFRLEYFVLAQTAAYLTTAAVAFVAIVRRVPLKKLRFSLPFAIVILRKSLPFALLVLLMASYNRVDPVLLQRLTANGDYQAGIYASAFRLLDALTMVAYLVSVPLLPIYAKLTKPTADEGRQLASVTRMVTSLMLLFSITAAITLSMLGEPLMALLYEEHVEDSVAVFRILVYGIVPISITYVYGTLLTAGGRLRQLNLLAGVTLLVNVAVNVVCIPRHGAVGSAWASLIAQSFMAIAQLWVALKSYHIVPTVGYLLRLAGLAAVVVGGNLVVLPTWWLQLLLVAGVAVGYAVAVRLVDVGEIKSLIVEKE